MDGNQVTPNDEMTGADMDAEISDLASSLRSPTVPERSHPDRPEQIEPDKAGWIKPALSVVLILLASVFTVLNVMGYGPTQTRKTGLSEPARDHRLQARLKFAVTEVENYKDHHGRIPANLQDLGLGSGTGLTLVHLPDHQFQLRATDHNTSLTFDSTTPEKGAQS